MWVRITSTECDFMNLFGCARLVKYYVAGGIGHKLQLIGCHGDLDGDGVLVKFVGRNGVDALERIPIAKLEW